MTNLEYIYKELTRISRDIESLKEMIKIDKTSTNGWVCMSELYDDPRCTRTYHGDRTGTDTLIYPDDTTTTRGTSYD